MADGVDDSSLPELATDQVTGAYDVVRRIGSGGMGAVYEAVRRADGAHVALKVPFERVDRPTARRLRREAESLRRLDSPHVARVIDVIELDHGAPLIVLELLRGRDLRALLRQRGRIPAAEAARIVIQACAGVEAAHRLGIVHRDIKPSNLFLAEAPGAEPVVKLLDFGLARPPDDWARDDSTLTCSDAVVGSPRYLAPEVVRDGGRASPASDVWSLGVVLFELLTGVRPFEAPTVAGVLARIVAEPPRKLADHLDSVPAALDAIVLRCLEKDPARRYPSAEAMARDLAAFDDGEWTGSKWTRGVAAPEPGVRRRRTAAAAALGAAALAGFVVAVGGTPDGSPRPQVLARGLRASVASTAPRAAPEPQPSATPTAASAAPQPKSRTRATPPVTAAVLPLPAPPTASAPAFRADGTTSTTIETRK
ncbi:MAG: serine/threonine protein kinase [Polyangiaceae bacterium]|nr:serine/threonine protein kinase [Polyangiaceae bacterium]